MIHFFVFLIISSASIASTLILEKNAASGYVLPERSFVKDCKVYSDGQLESTTVNGDGTGIGFARIVPSINIQAIKVLNNLARKGPVTITPIPCDIGTTTLKGYLENEEIVIDSAVYCREKRFNNSSAASVLRSIAREMCGF